MLRSLLSLFLVLELAAGCAHHNRPEKGPVVETVRTPDSPTPPAAARDLAAVMTTTLHLRPEQTTRVRAIFSATVEQVNSARQKFAPKSPQLMAELKRINTASDTQLRQALGPATYKEFQAKKKQIQAEMQQRAK